MLPDRTCDEHFSPIKNKLNFRFEQSCLKSDIWNKWFQDSDNRLFIISPQDGDTLSNVSPIGDLWQTGPWLQTLLFI